LICVALISASRSRARSRRRRLAAARPISTSTISVGFDHIPRPRVEARLRDGKQAKPPDRYTKHAKNTTGDVLDIVAKMSANYPSFDHLVGTGKQR
jgi:hypothetical protein